MENKIDVFLSEINGGKLRGAQAKLARDIGVKESAVSKYISGISVPSKQAIKDMAKKYNKTVKEMEDIFDVKKHTKIKHNKLDVIEEKLDLILKKLQGDY